jgi:hypothetical protein
MLHWIRLGKLVSAPGHRSPYLHGVLPAIEQFYGIWIRGRLGFHCASLLTATHGVSPAKGGIGGNAGSRPRVSFSIRQAAPESACQWRSNATQPLLSQIARGREIQRLRQKKQSIRLPKNPEPSFARMRTIRSPGPSSSAKRWVTRQTASAERMNRHIAVLSLIQSSSSFRRVVMEFAFRGEFHRVEG